VLTEQEREVIDGGHKAERLLENADFQAFLEALRVKEREFVGKALLPGSTEFEKGVVLGLRLALGTVESTIEDMKEIALREEQTQARAESLGLDSEGEVENDLRFADRGRAP